MSLNELRLKSLDVELVSKIMRDFMLFENFFISPHLGSAMTGLCKKQTNQKHILCFSLAKCYASFVRNNMLTVVFHVL